MLRVDVPETGQLDVARLLGAERSELWLEIGFGGGEHLTWQAERNPGVVFLGCDLFVNGIASLLRHVHDRAVDNVRVAECEASGLLRALPDGATARAFLLFPDPWLKKRHRKRRLLQPQTLDDLARVLEPGAEFRFATDDGGYARQALALVLSHGAFAWPTERADDWRVRPSDWPQTRYEAAALRAGRCPMFFTFTRR